MGGIQFEFLYKAAKVFLLAKILKRGNVNSVEPIQNIFGTNMTHFKKYGRTRTITVYGCR